MGNSVITEKVIQENVKVSEKKQPDDNINAILPQKDTEENDSLQQAQEMISQLKSILGGSKNTSPPSSKPQEESQEEKGDVYRNSEPEEVKSAQPKIQGTSTSVGKEYSHFFNESPSEKSDEAEKTVAPAPPSQRKKEVSEKEDEESSDTLKEKLKAIKELKNTIKKGLEKSKEKEKDKKEFRENVETHEADADTSEPETSESQKSEEKKLREAVIISGDNTKKYVALKKEIEDGIKALEKLKEAGFIEDEDYKKSRELLVKKLELADLLLHKEAQKLTIIKLKERMSKLIDEFMEEEGVKKEKEKLKLYLQALQKLYDQGVVNEELYNKKRKIIEDKLATYDLVVDEIELVLNSFLNRIKKEIEDAENELEKLSKHEEKIANRKKEKTEEKESILKKLFSKKKSVKDDRYRQAIKELEEIYAKNEGRDAIPKMVLLVKREVENILGINEELTHAQVVEKIKSDERIDSETKMKLATFFEKMMAKEYQGKISDDDVHEVYEGCKDTLHLIFTDLKKSVAKEEGKKEEKKVEEKSEDEYSEIRSEEQKTASEEPPNEEVKEGKNTIDNVSKKSENVERKERDKKSLFQKINEFFGV